MASHNDDRSWEDELHDVDWEAVENTAEFQELVRSRRRFVVPATVFFLVWYLGFIALAGYAEDFMAESVIEGLTVGYCLALTQFVMVAVLGLMYLRRARETFDPLADQVARMVADRGSRFARDPDARPAGDRTPAAQPVTTTDPEARS
jgi:uncharacterized membrane protein (DUF485 family)